MSAGRPVVGPGSRPRITPATPSPPGPVTTSLQPNARSFSATKAAVSWTSKSSSGAAWSVWRQPAISGCSSAKRLIRGMEVFLQALGELARGVVSSLSFCEDGLDGRAARTPAEGGEVTPEDRPSGLDDRGLRQAREARAKADPRHAGAREIAQMEVEERTGSQCVHGFFSCGNYGPECGEIGRERHVETVGAGRIEGPDAG